MVGLCFHVPPLKERERSKELKERERSKEKKELSKSKDCGDPDPLDRYMKEREMLVCEAVKAVSSS